MMFKREIYPILFNRLKENRGFMQVLTGPRQVGKTTLVHQVAQDLSMPTLYASADEPTLRGGLWVKEQWEAARQIVKEHGTALLILDEVQKVQYWSSSIKLLWDEDTRQGISLKVVLLGSAPLLMESGLTESLAGRFEKIPVTHWNLNEMQAAFGWTLEQYIYFGGYPGSAALIHDEERWRRYINDSLIETTLSRDILLLNPIQKPALLRRLFELACRYSGQILSFQKMVGQLQDAGNTTTLAHYLQLLQGAGMAVGLSKFAGQVVRQRGSSPKLQVFNTALLSSLSNITLADAKKDHAFWGRLVESSVGAHIINSARAEHFDVFYWREKNKEVDFILKKGNALVAIEVKSQMIKEALTGLEAFAAQFNPQRSLVVGGPHLSMETFLKTPVVSWFG